MSEPLIHIVRGADKAMRPLRFTFPFSYVPHPWAQAAAEDVMAWVRTYIGQHPDTELRRTGKMFGVLVVQTADGQIGSLRAFSAMLDGSYFHEGFVPPVFDISDPNGYFKQEEAAISAINKELKESTLPGSAPCEDAQQQRLLQLKAERKQRSQALQQWMFSQYRMLNRLGEEKDLHEIFRTEKPILTEEEYFGHPSSLNHKQPDGRSTINPQQPDGRSSIPSGAGECCAPKLLQTAFREGLTPLCMAEFWMGASPQKELRIEGRFYPACQSRCKPILRHMLAGIDTDDDPVLKSSKSLADQTVILFEDEHLIAVAKPSGLLTAPGAEGAYSLQDWVQEHAANGQEALPAHRLDMDTSGIILFGKTREAYLALQALFREGKVQKRYEAVVSPADELPEATTIRLPLIRDPFDRPRQRVDYQHGKPATTEVRIRENRTDGSCLLDLYPQTGRTHQLRIHCAHPDGLNAPILGDRLYGDSRTAPRLMLHAAELRLTHPMTGEELHLISPSGF